MVAGGSVELESQFERALDRTFNRGKYTTKMTRKTVHERLHLGGNS